MLRSGTNMVALRVAEMISKVEQRHARTSFMKVNLSDVPSMIIMEIEVKD